MTFGPWDVVCGDAWQWRAHTAIHSTGVVHCGHSIGHNVFIVNYDISYNFAFSKCEAPRPLIFLAFLNNTKLESEIRFRCQTTRRLMFAPTNTPVQIWNLGIWEFAMLRDSLIEPYTDCEA